MSDPLATYPVAIPETGATILITPCPGKRQRDLGRRRQVQRRARREVEQLLRKRLDDLDVIAGRLLEGLDPEVT